MTTKDPLMVSSMEFPERLGVSFDVDAFDDAIRSQGVKLLHYRAMRCPVGLIDRYDNRRPDHDHSGCSNGFIYTKAGDLTALFTNNNKAPRQNDVGVVDGSTVQVTIQRFYDDTVEPVYAAPFDRFYLNEEKIVVPTWQLFEANITGKEKLQFPAVKVQDLMSADGRKYTEGVDFQVKGGYIQWVSENRPTYDASRNKGQICSVRYLYRPYWYCQRMLHEVRVTQAEDRITGQRMVQRMPQAMVLQREYVFEKEESTQEGETSERQIPAPRDGGFGPR